MHHYSTNSGDIDHSVVLVGGLRCRIGEALAITGGQRCGATLRHVRIDLTEFHSHVFLSPDLICSGACRVTYFGRAGITGHLVFRNEYAAFRVVVANGYRRTPVHDLDELARQDNFRCDNPGCLNQQAMIFTDTAGLFV